MKWFSIMTRGRFIVFEGGEGTGKSTQLKKVQSSLHKHGISCCITQEPGGTLLGKKLRALILRDAGGPVTPEVELLLVLADRLHHVQSVIEPALAQGKWVICDRFIDSCIVYQALAIDKDPDIIYRWHAYAGIHLIPDMTFLFQEPVSVALQRRHRQSKHCNKFDYATQDFHEKVARAYESLVHLKHYVCLPSHCSIDQITQRIVHEILHYFHEDKITVS